MSAGVRIRRAEPADAPGLHALFTEPAAYAATLQLPYPSLAAWEQRLRELAPHVVQLVAEVGAEVGAEGGIAGAAGFEVLQSPRRRHVAHLGMAVASAHQGKGVGTQLLQAVIDSAERWHGVHRLELEVYTDNAAAIALYQRHGFEREGLARGYALRDGVYVDVLLMARLQAGMPAPRSVQPG